MTGFYTAVLALADSPLGWFALLLGSITGAGYLLALFVRTN